MGHKIICVPQYSLSDTQNKGKFIVKKTSTI